MTRIQWSDLEREQVIRSTVDSIRNNPGMPLLVAIREAQKSLPEFRQRKINTITEVSYIKRGVEKLLKSPRKEDKQLEVITVEIPYTPPVEDLLCDIPTSLLLANLFDRLSVWINYSKEQFLAVKHDKPVPVKPVVRAAVYPPPLKPRYRIPRVAIVGLLKDQFAAVQDKLENVPVELVNVPTDTGHEVRVPHVNFAVVTKFVSHSGWDKFVSIVGKDKVRFAQGVTDTVQKVYDCLSMQNNNK